MGAAGDGFGELALPTLTRKLLRHAGLRWLSGSLAPDVGDVARQAPGRDGDRSKRTAQPASSGPPLQVGLGGARDPRLLQRQQRRQRVGPVAGA